MSHVPARCLPPSLAELLRAFRPCFTSRGFDTFTALVAGLIAAPARRSVCEMLTASGMNAVWHHSRAHRFFASARWSPDQLGLAVLGLVIGWLLPAGARATPARRVGRRPVSLVQDLLDDRGPGRPAGQGGTGVNPRVGGYIHKLRLDSSPKISRVRANGTTGPAKGGQRSRGRGSAVQSAGSRVTL
jgi:hypothetical protein